MIQAAFGMNRRHWTNEKGMLPMTDSFVIRPDEFRHRIEDCLGNVGTDTLHLTESLKKLMSLLHEVP